MFKSHGEFAANGHLGNVHPSAIMGKYNSCGSAAMKIVPCAQLPVVVAAPTPNAAIECQAAV